MLIGEFSGTPISSHQTSIYSLSKQMYIYSRESILKVKLKTFKTNVP